MDRGENLVLSTARGRVHHRLRDALEAMVLTGEPILSSKGLDDCLKQSRHFSGGSVALVALRLCRSRRRQLLVCLMLRQIQGAPAAHPNIRRAVATTDSRPILRALPRPSCSRPHREGGKRCPAEHRPFASGLRCAQLRQAAGQAHVVQEGEGMVWMLFQGQCPNCTERWLQRGEATDTEELRRQLDPHYRLSVQDTSPLHPKPAGRGYKPTVSTARATAGPRWQRPACAALSRQTWPRTAQERLRREVLRWAASLLHHTHTHGGVEASKPLFGAISQLEDPHGLLLLRECASYHSTRVTPPATRSAPAWKAFAGPLPAHGALSPSTSRSDCRRAGSSVGCKHRPASCSPAPRMDTIEALGHQEAAFRTG